MPQWIRATEDPSPEPSPALPAQAHIPLSWLPWIVLAIGLLATALVVGAMQFYTSARFELRFDERADRVMSRILTRTSVYEQMLRSAAGLIDLPGRVSAESWRRYVAQLDLQHVYPGVLAVGYNELVDAENLAHHEELQRNLGRADYAVRPREQQALLAPTVLIAPETEENLEVIGFDSMSEPGRRAAIETALATRGTAISQPLSLIQDPEAGPGFLMFHPVQDLDLGPPALASTEGKVRGFVHAVIRARVFLAPILNGEPDITLEVFDGTESTAENLLYQSGGAENAPRFSRQDIIELPGRSWTVRTASRGDAWHSNMPIVTGIAGLAISGSLFLITLAAKRNVEHARKTQEALAQAEQRFFRMADTMPAVLWVSDEQGNLIFVNRHGVELVGGTKEGLLGKAWLEYVHPDDRQMAIATAADAKKMGESYTHQFRVRVADGSYRWFVNRGTPHFDEAGRLVRYVGFLFDITDLRQTQEQLQQAQKMESVGRLTGGIAHDFNNLLTVIEGNCELILDDPEAPESVKQLASASLHAAERAEELTRGMLAFARKQPLAPKVIEINKVLDRMEPILRRALGEDIDLLFQLDGALWTAFADAGQLEAALLNLAVNARDAMPEGGRLTIETANRSLDADYAAEHAEVKPGDYVMVAVSDTGQGMPPEVLEHIFEPFYTTKQAGRGTGLGLSIVFGFVKQSGGHIKAYSEPGLGTSMKIYLPRADGREHAASRPGRSSEESLPTGTETILVVEDDTLVRGFIESQLPRLGYKVIAVADGPSAIEVIDSGEPVDLLLTDVIMPGGMNGRELADLAIERRPGLKVLYMSGYAATALFHQGRLDPSVRLLSKPFRKGELAAKVREALDNDGMPD